RPTGFVEAARAEGEALRRLRSASSAQGMGGCGGRRMTSRALKNAQVNQGVAAEPANSVFVTANPRSCTTKAPAGRIARLLLQGSKPSAFLCSTYTKAAAAEMQRRLFERLGAWCVADDETLSKELIALGEPSHDLGRARKLFAQALETPGGLKIQTIHAFCE